MGWTDGRTALFLRFGALVFAAAASCEHGDESTASVASSSSIASSSSSGPDLCSDCRGIIGCYDHACQAGVVYDCISWPAPNGTPCDGGTCHDGLCIPSATSSTGAGSGGAGGMGGRGGASGGGAGGAPIDAGVD